MPAFVKPPAPLKGRATVPLAAGVKVSVPVERLSAPAEPARPVMAVLAPMETVPALTVSVEKLLLALVSDNVAVPAFVRLPFVTAPEKVVAAAVVSWRVAPPRPTVPLKVRSPAPVASPKDTSPPIATPLPKDRATEPVPVIVPAFRASRPLPNAALSPPRSVPAESVVVPLYELDDEIVVSPPACMTAPVPEIVPE